MKLLLALALILPLSAAPTVKTDIRYQRVRGSLPERQHLDVHYDDATTKTKQPVLLWIHGGAWRFGSKEHATPQKAAALHNSGIILVAVNYRFHPQVTYKEQGADIVAAIKWTRDHIADYGGDPNRLAKALKTTGASASVSPAKDKTHMTLNKEWGSPGDPPTKVCLEFLAKNLADQ